MELIKCVSNLGYRDELTLGKTYKTLWSGHVYVAIVNDNKEAATFPKVLFVDADKESTIQRVINFTRSLLCKSSK